MIFSRNPVLAAIAAAVLTLLTFGWYARHHGLSTLDDVIPLVLLGAANVALAWSVTAIRSAGEQPHHRFVVLGALSLGLMWGFAVLGALSGDRIAGLAGPLAVAFTVAYALPRSSTRRDRGPLRREVALTPGAPGRRRGVRRRPHATSDAGRSRSGEASARCRGSEWG